jgi:hypothetical protein
LERHDTERTWSEKSKSGRNGFDASIEEEKRVAFSFLFFL